MSNLKLSHPGVNTIITTTSAKGKKLKWYLSNICRDAWGFALNPTPSIVLGEIASNVGKEIIRGIELNTRANITLKQLSNLTH